MMIARWQIDARFGHKQEALDSMKRWQSEIGRQIGWKDDMVRVLTGSIGARESLIETEIQVAGLGEIDAAWAKLAKIAAHQKWGKELEPLIVSGTPRWEVYRVIEQAVGRLSAAVAGGNGETRNGKVFALQGRRRRGGPKGAAAARRSVRERS